MYGLNPPPTHLEIIATCPWRYGDSPDGREDSFMFAKVQAFAGKAAFSTPAKRVALGEPVVGFLEPSAGLSKSAHLVVWDAAPLLGWKLSYSHTRPPSPWDLNPDTLYVIPQLAATNL